MNIPQRYKTRRAKIAAIGIVVGVMIAVNVFFSAPAPMPATPDAMKVAVEAARKDGYTEGYNAAKADAVTAYKTGYEAAQKEIGHGALTTFGIVGFITGFALSAGGVIFLNRKTLREKFEAARRKYEMKKAFDDIPPNLPADVYKIAEQIARSYAAISNQLRTNKGYLVTQYAKEWRTKLDELMGKSVNMMHLIQELNAAETLVNEAQLTERIDALKITIRRAKDDDTRTAAMKSLKQAKQTQQELEKTQTNLQHCKAALQGVPGILDSLHLRISNIKVNTQKSDLLDELSSDLEHEMSALEESLREVNSDDALRLRLS